MSRERFLVIGGDTAGTTAEDLAGSDLSYAPACAPVVAARVVSRLEQG